MQYKTFQTHIERWRELNPDIDIWLDEDMFGEHNSQFSPGATISRYGYWVIGSTVGGNAITLSSNDSAVRFCDHTGWYDNYMCFAAKEDYANRPYTSENVRLAQIVLADSISALDELVRSGELDNLIDKYD